MYQWRTFRVLRGVDAAKGQGVLVTVGLLDTEDGAVVALSVADGEPLILSAEAVLQLIGNVADTQLERQQITAKVLNQANGQVADIAQKRGERDER